MSFSDDQKLPEGYQPLPPVQRRHKRRTLNIEDSNSHAAFLKELTQQIIPSLDFFIFSLVAGLMIGIALLLDSQPFGVLAAAIAPFLGPVIGISLAAVLGSMTFFLQTLGSIGIGSLLVFLSSACVGWATKWLPIQTSERGLFYTQFSWENFCVLTLAAILTTYLCVRLPKKKPAAVSVALAYELYLPLGAAGFGLTSGIPHLWPNGAAVFAIHLVWAALIGIIVLLLLGFRPLGVLGYVLSASLALVGIAAVVIFSSMGRASYPPIVLSQSTDTPTPMMSPSNRPSLSPPTQTDTPSPTRTLLPSRTPTTSATPVPTPVFARINAAESNGAFIRAKPDPNANVVISMLNGLLVEVLPDSQETQDVLWIHVRLPDGREGWILHSLLTTITPTPE